MTDPKPSPGPETDALAGADERHKPGLAEVAARRMAARSQWQMALARAKDRFAPASVKEELISTAAETIGGAADKAASLALAHRGKIAVTGLLGGVAAALVIARKPIARAAGPRAGQIAGEIKARASTTASKALKAFDILRARLKR